MDEERFDRLIQSVSRRLNRRGVVGALLGVAAAGLPETVAFGRGKHHKSKDRHKDRKQERKKDRQKERQVPRKLDAEQENCWRVGTCIPKKGSNVSRCNLEGSTAFAGLDCTGCNVSRANLHDVDATGANFTRANLSGSCLVDADFSGATFANNTNLYNAIFCRTTMPGGGINNSGCNKATACCPTCVPIGEQGCDLGGSCCGGANCQTGACTCPANKPDACAGACTNRLTDPKNCGSCGNTCGQGETCCSGGCKNLNDDEANCGSCGNGCGSGETCCNGVCKDLNTDPNNCGECGNACGQNQVCSGGVCCLPDSANLQTAIDNTPEGGTLRLCAGTWVVPDTIMINTNNLTLFGAGSVPDGTILSGAGHAGTVLSIGGDNVTVRDLAVTNGHADYGAGIYNFGSSTQMQSVRVSGNTATQNGGGIRNVRNLTLTDCSVTGNAASYGGGIDSYGTLGLTLSRSVVANNTASQYGGGIYNNNGGRLTLKKGTAVSQNTGPGFGGGIANLFGAILTVEADVTVDHNTAKWGGGISNESRMTLQDGASVANNTATIQGGGIWTFYDSNTTLEPDSHVTLNTANVNGGGIFNNGGTIDDADPSIVADNSPNNCAGISPVANCVG
jgi:hypothetical protein